MKVAFAPAAQDDLLEIAVYIAQGNPTRALSFVDELEAKCYKLGGTPGIGVARPELAEGLRVLPYRRYLIFYREHEHVLRIERILHSARDITSDEFGLDG
jgi:toxin ParE1/3/4